MTNPQTEARAIARSASPTVRKLFDAIRESGSSELDIADAAGVSHATLHYWRAGNRSPTIMLLEAVASVLGYNIELVKADHATALAAKDEELAKFDFEKHSLKVSLARAEAALAEARKALGLMLREHDTLSGNFGDVVDPKHRRPDRWPTAASAARRALTGGKVDG